MTSYENASCDLNINSFYNIDLYELFPLPYGPLSKSSGIISSDNKLVGSLLKVAVLEFPPQLEFDVLLAMEYELRSEQAVE